MNTTTKNSRVRNSISLKLAVIIALSLLLLIPTLFISKLIDERQMRRNETISEVTSKWGGAQTVFSPVLVIPYKKYEKTSKNTYIAKGGYFHLLPDELDIKGDIAPEIRYRGIYKVVTYSSNLTINGKFSGNSFKNWPDSPDEIQWSEAVILTGITDLTGLDKISKITWNDQLLNTEGGIPYESSVYNGIHSPLNLEPKDDNTFHMEITLNGSESLYFIPSGKTTSVNLSSNWSTPSFDGSTLPDKKQITDESFTAQWNVLDLTRSFPQKWSSSAYSQQIAESAFGVNLLVPVDIYQKTTRSVKYALLFIGLTFLVIFFIEIISKTRIHPIQYLLTGAALIIFYSLLLALSEHMIFALAYAAAGAGVIILITSYIHALFAKIKYTLVTLSMLIILYGFLFAILHMSDMALLIGNIGLFTILAVIMYFSRKIEWYIKPNSIKE